jgi:dipeptidyl aminopeptidase/acylaminoacyl peptidase
MNSQLVKRSIIISIICLTYQFSFGQNQKKKLTQKDYDSWCLLEDENIAPNGKWLSFKLKYNNGKDTLVLKTVKNNKAFNFPNASNGQFSSDSKWFTYSTHQKKLILLNLEKNSQLEFDEVKKYQIDQGSNSIGVLSNRDTLVVINLKKQKTIVIPKVKEFEFSSNGNLAIAKDTSVVVGTTDNPFAQIPIANSKQGFKNLVWNNNNGFAFFENQEKEENTNQNHAIGYYNLINKKYYHLNSNDFPELNQKSIVKPFGQKGIVIEPNDNKVIFYINNREKAKIEPRKMEVWEYNSPLEYPSQEVKGNFENTVKMAIWWPITNELKIIGTNQRPNTIVCPLSNYVLSFNPLDYEPQFELAAPVDLYLTNLKTNKTILLLEKQSQKAQTMGASANGNYFYYYRDKNWWIYDLKRETHTNITKDLPFPVENFKQDEPGPKYGFGCGAWSSDNQHIFIYDEYDIWMIAADGKTKKRITNGRETLTQFRIEEELYVNRGHRGSIEFLSTTVNKKAGIICTAIDQNKNWGYYIWKEKQDLIKIQLENSKASRMKIASNSQDMIWIEEEVTRPPRILFTTPKEAQPKIVYQSNKQYTKYESRTAELMKYTNAKGDTLNAVLYYPVGYKKEKKYPMIVYIYEKLSQRLHQYDNPTLYDRAGFAVANYNYDAYFVLLPDIIYEIGNPGISAKDCVESAVNEAIKTEKIDPNRMGIYGHSFGGYQVASIITQTDIFKAAVVGSGVTDLTNLYLQMNWNFNRTQAWRFESQQMRMGSNPLENFEGYKNNSPIANAAKINTPVLIWTGKEDYNVDWNQSIYLHMALRRFKKENKLLLFPNEGHTINTKENQVLLTKEIKNWFDEHLK